MTPREENRGIESGRFAIDNPEAAATLLSGAMIGALSDRLEGTLDDSDLDDAAQYLLCLLGVSPDEAREIAHRPLPELGADIPNG